MNEKIQNAFKATKSYLSKHSPEILIGLGIASMTTSTILAVKATPKALKLLEYEKNQNGKDLTKKEVIKTTWKEYIPAASFGIGGIVCVACGCRIGTKRSAALATAYAISERTLLTYKDKVIETIGEKKEREIRQKIKQDEIDKNPPVESKVIITQKGNSLIKDEYSGRYFRSDLDSIRKACNELNKELLHSDYMSLNQWYSAIGLEMIKDGHRLGWNIDKGLLELDFDTCLVGDEPCIVIEYSRAPEPNFDMMCM